MVHACSFFHSFIQRVPVDVDQVRSSAKRAFWFVGASVVSHAGASVVSQIDNLVVSHDHDTNSLAVYQREAGEFFVGF